MVTHSGFGAGGGEVSAHQVWVPRHVRVGLGGADPLGAAHTLDAGGAHQPGDLVGPTSWPARRERPSRPSMRCRPGSCPPTTAARPGVSPDRAGPRRRLPVLDPVVAARGHLQHAADELDPQTSARDDLVAVGVDERGYFWCWRSSSAPKKLARFKISLARLSSRFSCSSSMMRLASAGSPRARDPGRCPPA